MCLEFRLDKGAGGIKNRLQLYHLVDDCSQAVTAHKLCQRELLSHTVSWTLGWQHQDCRCAARNTTEHNRRNSSAALPVGIRWDASADTAMPHRQLLRELLER